MESAQKKPIRNTSEDIIASSGSDGTFLCTPSFPFNYRDLVGDNKIKLGFVVKFITKDGSLPVVGSIVANGVLGDVDQLTGEWLSGEGFAIEIEELTMVSGIACILLKEVTNL